MKTLFLRLYDFFEKRSALLWLVFFGVLGVTGYLASQLKMEERIQQLLPETADRKVIDRFLDNSSFTDRVLIAVSQNDTTAAPDPDALVAVTDSLAAAIRSTFPDFVSAVNEKTDDSEMEAVRGTLDEHLPLFLDGADYAWLDSLTSPEGIRDKVASNFRMLTGPGGFALKQSILDDPLGLRWRAYQKLSRIQADDQVEIYDGHYLTRDQRHVFAFIQPRYPATETRKNAYFFSRLDSLISAAGTQFPESKIVYFGAPAVAAGNSTQIRTDSVVSVSVMVLILVIFLSLFFRRLTAPLLILVPVVQGGLFAMACMYLIQGTVSVIALGAGSLVLGIAVNYSLHFLTHHRYHPDKRAAIAELAFPMTMGSLTTIGGFLCLLWVNTPVLRDLGLFAALSLCGAALSTLIFLPHFTWNKSAPPKADSVWEKSATRISNLFPKKYRTWAILACTPVFLFFARDIQFETDMNKLNFMSDKLKQSEADISGMSSLFQKSVFVISSGATREAALAAGEKIVPLLDSLQNKGKLVSATGVTSVYPSAARQQERIRQWEQYWSPARRDSVHDRLVRAGAGFHFKATAFDGFDRITARDYLPLDSASARALATLTAPFIQQHADGWSVVEVVRTIPRFAPEVHASLERHPEAVVFDRQQLTEQLVTFAGDDFNFITWWTSIMVFVALLLIYGRIELTLITFIPMLLSWIWILGIMTLLGIKFNMINIVLSTFIFALGDDFCIFTTDGMLRKYAYNKKDTGSIPVSVALSAITTILGLGMLLLARHPALHSIALVSVIGIACVWLISQTVQPALFRFLITNPTSKKHEPYTFWNLVKSIFAFSWFFLGSMIVTVIGFGIMYLLPLKKVRRRYLYHVVLSTFTGSLIYVMANVKKKIINETGEDFKKPAVLIANHSSFLDILLTTMLHPKLILLTNKWVWNSPVFGPAIHMAEYYPVAEGAANTVPRLAEKVADGYSIVVFPEGTRSPDGKIGRFHKGAFYLAQELHLDILPLVIHGAQYTMTKNFFYLKNGRLSVRFLPRIQQGDARFGESIRDQAKQIGKYMREKYRETARMVESPAYFKNRLISNYLYKGPVLEWYLRIKIKLEGYYEPMVNLVPHDARVVDIGCGYGFLAYMLAYTGNERDITGIDYDEEKIGIARNGYDKPANLHFEVGDATTYDFGEADVIFLNDVLHYLPAPEQEALLIRCMARVRSGGKLVVRDGIRELKSRHQGTRLSEWFSTKLLKFNKTSTQKLEFISRGLIDRTAGSAGFHIQVLDHARYTSNLIFVLQKPQ